jgi:hypothetical protein
MTVASPEETDNEAALLQRLQSQFGDMDITSFMVPLKDGSVSDAESDESSVVEPTAQELLAWQEAQFKRGKLVEDTKKKIQLTDSELVVEARKQRRQQRQSEEQQEDWEEVHHPPDLNGQESAFFTDSKNLEMMGAHPLLSKLAATDPDVFGGRWLRLYSSNVDGLSFSNLSMTLRGYDGPTVMLVGTIPSAVRTLDNHNTSTQGGTLGVYTTTPWKESSQFYGTDDCFLFRIDQDDTIHVFHPTTDLKRKDNYQCWQQSLGNINKKSGTEGVADGLGVGGILSQPRLHLTESLEQCRALPYKGTFEQGDLLPNGGDSLYFFDVDVLEVWGVGGEGWQQVALQAREAERVKLAAQRKRVQTLDKTQLLDDFRTGLLGNALFGHTEHIVGRTD